MSPEFSERVDSIEKSRIREFFDLVSTEKDIISLGVGEPDFLTPWTIREAAIFAIEKGDTCYTSNQGLPELREEIAKYLDRHYQYRYCPDNEILICNGVSEGVDLVLRALLNPGDEVIIPTPAYVCYTPLVQLAGGNAISIDTQESDFIPDPAQIAATITEKTKAIVLCYPNNPTGRNIPKSVLKEIAELAAKNNIWIISDEIYAELIYDSEFTSFPSISGTDARVVLCKGFSKAHAMTGWRIGYICGPESIISRALKIHQYTALCASTIAQLAAVEALKEADHDVEEMRASYQKRRDIVLKGFQEAGIHMESPEGAFYCFPSIASTGLNCIEFAKELLEEERVAVVPGIAFGEGLESYIRCCYAIAVPDLIEAMKRIQRFIKKRRQ